MSEEESPKTQPESDRPGRLRKTAIGAGEGGKLRTVVCHRNEVFCYYLSAQLNALIEMVAHTSSGDCGIEELPTLKPDLMLIDIDLDAFHPVRCREMIEKLPELSIVLMADSLRAALYQADVRRVGAHALCLKTSGKQTFVDAIQHAVGGEFYKDPAIRSNVFGGRLVDWDIPNFRGREFELFIRLNQSDEQICSELLMKRRSFELALQNILRLLNADTREAAAAIASSIRERIQEENGRVDC